MSVTARPLRVGVAALSSAVLLAGCASTTTSLSSRERDVRSSDTNVKFHLCGDACTGTIAGAKYSIVLPDKWNGTLLLYSHGYRFASPVPADGNAPVENNAQVSSTDRDGTGADPLSKYLLKKGYALAGSSYKSNGWAVGDGVVAGEALHRKFVTVVGTPKRTYVWGDSLGGLVTEILAEKNTAWVDGAAPMCGAVAGPNLNFDAALDVAFAVKTLIDPSFTLTGYSSAEEANQQWESVSAAMKTAAADFAGGGTAKVLFIAGLVGAPDRTKTYDGSDIVSQVKATVESLLTALAFGTAGRYEVEQRVGGNPTDNSKTDYATRVNAGLSSLVGSVGGDVAQYEQQLQDAPKVSADPAARAAFEKIGDTTGAISAQTVTMHTEDDPLVLVSNESVLAQRARSEKRSGNLVQLYIAPPTSYTETAGAPYGAGHCNFSDGQREALIATLDHWVRASNYPLASGLSKAFGPGLDPGFLPGPWPTESSS